MSLTPVYVDVLEHSMLGIMRDWASGNPGSMLDVDHTGRVLSDARLGWDSMSPSYVHWSKSTAQQDQYTDCVAHPQALTDLDTWLTPERVHAKAEWLQGTWAREAARRMNCEVEPSIYGHALGYLPLPALAGSWEPGEQVRWACAAGHIDPSELENIGGIHGDTVRMGIMLYGYNVDTLFAILGLRP